MKRAYRASAPEDASDSRLGAVGSKAVKLKIPGTKVDRLIFCCILAVALAMIGVQVLPFFASHAYSLRITGPGTSLLVPVGVEDEGEERRWDVPGESGGLSLAYMPGKGFYVESASCPDQVCVHSGFINKAGQSIVCVPNEIIISLVAEDGNDGGGLDGILR